MAYKHLLHNRRAVRLGGVHLWRFHLGGGIYTVGPMSTLRFAQYVEAAGKMGNLLTEAFPAGEPPTRAALQLFRVLLPLMVVEPIKPAHLEHATAGQIMAVFEAWQEVNDLPYMLKSLHTSGNGKGHGLDRFVVSLAQAMHLRVREVLEQPYQEVLATIDALNAEAANVPEGAEPLDDDEKNKLSNLCAGMGVQVN